MPVMPSDYRPGSSDPVMILEFAVTSWCNYRCAYCVTPVHAHRPAAVHAFDHHPVASWVDAFGRVPFEFSLLCRGGEPFLDSDGFGAFLAGVGSLGRLRYVRVDTNGSWSPDRYADVPLEVRRRVQLNVSYHPTQVDGAAFSRRLARILEAGWRVGMVNYVMESAQASDYERVSSELEARHGVYVNPNPDALDPVWSLRLPGVASAARRRLSAFLPDVDVAHKTGAITAGRSCFYPSIAYFVAPDGTAERACGVAAAGEVRKLDFIGASASLRPLPAAVACPQPTCLCLDRYAFREDVPGRGRALDLLAEYVDDGRAHREARRRC